jgi:hypothetical protein
MTPAAILQALVDLGPRPPWWRPFARRRWRVLRESLAREAAVQIEDLLS